MFNYFPFGAFKCVCVPFAAFTWAMGVAYVNYPKNKKLWLKVAEVNPRMSVVPAGGHGALFESGLCVGRVDVVFWTIDSSFVRPDR